MSARQPSKGGAARRIFMEVASFLFLRDGSCSRICFVITRADTSGAITTRWRRAGDE